jgi:hypothetical protein
MSDLLRYEKWRIRHAYPAVRSKWGALAQDVR